VIARNSTFTYKGQAVDVRQVGADLGARYVLEGSVRRAADQIRVTAQLTDAKDGTHLWAETYDRDLATASIFEIQDEIAARVTAAVADSYGIIAQTALREIPDKTVENLTSYECVLRAYSHMLNQSEATYRAARACLETVTKDEPEYAQAWAMLAELYVDAAAIWGDLPQSAIQDAIGFANRAIKLAPENQYAWYALTYAYFALGDKDQLLAVAPRAVDLNPDNAGVVGPVGTFMAAAGEWERGMEIINRSIELNPNYPSWINYAAVTYYLLNEDYASALIKANDYVARAPDFYWAYVFSAATLGLMGKVDEAAFHLQKVRELNPEMESRMSEELSNWFFEDEPVAVVMEGLRKAGLVISDDPAAAD